MCSIRKLVLATFALSAFTFTGNLGAQTVLAGEREADITSISGVVADNAKWSLI